MSDLKTKVSPVLVLAFATIVFFAPALRAVQNAQSDYRDHAILARAWLDIGELPVPHFLYHLLSIAVSMATSVDLLEAGFWIGLASSIVLAVVVYRVLADALASAGRSPPVRAMAVGVALSLLIVTPIHLFTAPFRNLYFGYLSPTTYHNPTITLLKPLALLLFLECVRLFARAPSSRPSLRTVGIAALVVASTLAKPSYTVCLVPALAVMAAWTWQRGGHVEWLAVASGVAIPAAAVLGWQFATSFGEAGSAGVVIDPFRAMSFRTSTSGLLPKYLLSVAFPASVYVLLFPICWRRQEFGRRRSTGPGAHR
jgi:hypothetical protein